MPNLSDIVFPGWRTQAKRTTSFPSSERTTGTSRSWSRRWWSSWGVWWTACRSTPRSSPFNVSSLHFPIPHIDVTMWKHCPELTPTSRPRHLFKMFFLFALSTMKAQIPPNTILSFAAHHPRISAFCQNVSCCGTFHFKLNQRCKYVINKNKKKTKQRFTKCKQIKQSFLLLMYF